MHLNLQDSIAIIICAVVENKMLFYLEPNLPKKEKSVGDEESSSIVPTGAGVGVTVVVVVILLAFVIYRMKRYTLNRR